MPWQGAFVRTRRSIGRLSFLHTMLPVAERYVFVYGTLRRGECNDITRLRPAPRFLGRAQLPGTLYDLGAYPGAVFGGTDLVVGEVYAIAPALEHQLDLIEEVAPVPSGEYHRREVAVELDGRRLICLAYEIDPRRVGHARRIVSADWCRR